MCCGVHVACVVCGLCVVLVVLCVVLVVVVCVCCCVVVKLGTHSLSLSCSLCLSPSYSFLFSFPFAFPFFFSYLSSSLFFFFFFFSCSFSYSCSCSCPFSFSSFFFLPFYSLFSSLPFTPTNIVQSSTNTASNFEAFECDVAHGTFIANCQRIARTVPTSSSPSLPHPQKREGTFFTGIFPAKEFIFITVLHKFQKIAAG